MIEKTVQEIEKTVTQSPTLSPEKRDQLLRLLGELKKEIQVLSRTHQESALGIADRTHASTRQATREDADRPALDETIADLKETVGKFEASHPGLVSTVNAFCNALADLGI